MRRRRDSVDGRRVLAALTSEGRALAAAATEPLNEIRFGLGVLEDGEAEVINGLLRRVRESVGDLAGDIPDPWSRSADPLTSK